MKYFLWIGILALASACKSSTVEYTTWEITGGNKEGIRYSTLKEIDTSNVNQLQPAWIFNTGDADTARFSQIQCNPIIVDSVMYVTSPTLKLFALHAATGKKLWEFNPALVIS